MYGIWTALRWVTYILHWKRNMNCMECEVWITWNVCKDTNFMDFYGMKYELYEWKGLHGIRITWIVSKDIWNAWNMNCMPCMCVALWAYVVMMFYSLSVVSHHNSVRVCYRFHSITQNTGSPADLLMSLLLHTKIIAYGYAYVYWLCIDAYIYYWHLEMLIWLNVYWVWSL